MDRLIRSTELANDGRELIYNFLCRAEGRTSERTSQANRPVGRHTNRRIIVGYGSRLIASSKKEARSVARLQRQRKRQRHRDRVPFANQGSNNPSKPRPSKRASFFPDALGVRPSSNHNGYLLS